MQTIPENVHIMLMSRDRSDYIRKLQKAFGKSNSTAIIDNEIDDSFAKNSGFVGMGGGAIKSPSAWEKAMYHIEKNIHSFKNIDFFYFMEDDVFSNDPATFISLINEYSDVDADLCAFSVRNEKSDPKWSWWRQRPLMKDISFYWCSLNPFARLSKRLIEKFYKYKNAHKVLVHQEMMFATIAYKNGLTLMDWRKQENYPKYFGNFNYRPIIDRRSIKDGRIYHPVKN